MSQRLLVTSTGTLTDTETAGFCNCKLELNRNKLSSKLSHSNWSQRALTGKFFLYLQNNTISLSYLDVLSQAVEDLFGHIHCFGEISFTRLINNVFSWVVPVKVTDWLLNTEKRGKKWQVLQKSSMSFWPKYIYNSNWPSGQCGLRFEEEDQRDLQPEQVIHSADNDIDGGGAACLSPQVVLKI